MYNSNPSPEELAEWYSNAVRRNALLPVRIRVRGRYTDIVCGRQDCQHEFSRKLLPNRNDPVYVCPSCGSRNYLPIEW
jgi:DNA-directed RNA polymerase subunit RPC12/RpoP